jgi:hypothetical protein
MLEIKKKCYMALGFGPNMSASDVIAAEISGSEIKLTDRYSSGYSSPAEDS